MTDPSKAESPVLNVALSEGAPEQCLLALLTCSVEDELTLQTCRFTTERELLRILESGQCDLVFCYIGNVQWNIPPTDRTSRRITRMLHRFKRLHPDVLLLPQRIRRFNITRLHGNVTNGIRALVRIHREFGVQVIATQGMDLSRQLSGSGITFLPAPYNVHEARAALMSAVVRRLAKRSPAVADGR